MRDAGRARPKGDVSVTGWQGCYEIQTKRVVGLQTHGRPGRLRGPQVCTLAVLGLGQLSRTALW